MSDAVGQEVAVPDFVGRAEDLARAVPTVEIVDSATLAAAADWAARLDQAYKEAEKAREFLVKPLNDHVVAINRAFKPRTLAIAAGLRAMKDKIAAYHAERTREEQEAARAAAEFLGKSAEVQEIVASREEKRVVDTGLVAVGTSTRWDYEVADLRALLVGVLDGNMPLELVAPDKGALRRWLNGLDKAGRQDDSVVYGVRVHKVKDVRLS